jgi:hypothetical protein
MENIANRHPDGSAESPSACLTKDQWNQISDRSLEIARDLGLNMVGIHGDYARFGKGNGSLKVWFKGPYRGTWWDITEKGDMISLIRNKSGMGFLDAVEFALKERLPDPELTKHKRSPKVVKSDYNREEFAKQQWLKCRSLFGTLAETYATEHRGIPSEVVFGLDRAGRIRFHPAFRSFPKDRPHPAFVIPATDLAGTVHGLQGVRLKPCGNKLDKDAKRSLGVLSGTKAVGWLSGGEGEIINAEGPEDALAVYAARPDAMVGAAFGGFKRLVESLPPAPRRVILAVQNDGPDSDAAKALPGICELLTVAGYDIWIARPPAGIKDANDLIRAHGIDAVRAMLDGAQPFSLPTPPDRTKGDRFETCEPSFTAPTTTAAEAFAELKTAFIPAWTDQILPAVQRRRQWEAEAASAEEEGVSPPNQPLMPQLGLAPGMGVGKTEILIQAGKSSPGIRTAIFTPTHALAGDLERRINDLEAEDAAVWKGLERPDPQHPGCSMCHRLCTVKLLMASGGSATDLCGTKKKGWCQHHPNHPQSGQPGFEVCGTQRQNLEMANDQSRIVVMPHSMLTNPPPAALLRAAVAVPFADRTVTAERSAFDVVAIDEAPWFSMVKVRAARIDLADLNRIYVDEWQVPSRPGEDRQYASRRLREISVRTHDLLAESYDKAAFVRLNKAMFSDPSRPLTIDMCDEAHRLTWRLHIDPAQQVTPDMSDDDVRRTLRPIIQHNRIVRRLARFWKSLSEFLSGDTDTTPYLTLAPRAEKDAPKSDDDDGSDDEEAVADDTSDDVPTGNTIPCIALSWRMDIHPDWLKGPVIFADGTMNETLSRYWLPSLKVVSRAQASTPRSVYRRQIIDRPVSRHMVCPRNVEQVTRQERTRRNHAADLARLLELRASQFNGKGRKITEADGSSTRIDVGFIVPKALEDYWRANAMIPETTAAEVHHSGNVRGMTRLEVVAHETIISRILTSPPKTEELAWVASGRVGECLPKGEWYPTRDAGVLMRDGTGRKVKQVYHPDPIAEAVRWQICEANCLQDEARARAARRTDDTPLTIDILTDVALPLEVDEVVTYADIIGEVDQVSMSMARGMVAFDWLGFGLVCRDMFRSSKDLGNVARTWGVRNPERRMALDEIRRRIREGGATNALYIDSPYKAFVAPPLFQWRVYRYRPVGTDSVREMAISTQMYADPRAALEQVTGPLDEFEALPVPVSPVHVQEVPVAAPEPVVAPPASPESVAPASIPVRIPGKSSITIRPMGHAAVVYVEPEDDVFHRHHRAAQPWPKEISIAQEMPDSKGLYLSDYEAML